MENLTARRGRTAKRSFATGLVKRFEGKLSSEHFAVLMAASNGGYAGAAAALDIPIGTVKSRLNRARERLAAILSNERHPNGAPMWAPDGTSLDEDGNRSIFNDVDA